MKWTKRSVLEFFAVLAMTAVVLTLAILQYKWAKAISTVEQARLEGALDASVKNFNQEFSYDFDRLCESFEVNPVTPGFPRRGPRCKPLRHLDQNDFPLRFRERRLCLEEQRRSATNVRVSRFG